jgi:UDP-N-acetylmuramate dehydrogenase
MAKHSLQRYNTFGIAATATALVKIRSIKGLRKILQDNMLPIYLLGGGSNLLLIQAHYDWLFLKNEIKGIKIVSDTEGGVLVEIGGGEVWHDLVLWAIEHNLGGIENLSLIPGTVGAAPIQNIGAYGVELKNVFEKLEAIHLQTLDNQIFTKENCQFGYRDSVFKTQLKSQFFITKIWLKLQRLPHQLNSSYGDIQKILADKNITAPTIRDISNAVIQIRQSKLPNPKEIGNAGSFFKNPEIPTVQFERLKKDFPYIVGYSSVNGTKVAAGWLIEQCGWKGKRLGAVGVHDKQALVLVNYGGGKGLAIKQLANDIQISVKEKFGIDLIPEVNMI